MFIEITPNTFRKQAEMLEVNWNHDHCNNYVELRTWRMIDHRHDEERVEHGALKMFALMCALVGGEGCIQILDGQFSTKCHGGVKFQMSEFSLIPPRYYINQLTRCLFTGAWPTRRNTIGFLCGTRLQRNPL